MDNVFPTAVEARNGSRDNVLIYGEIRAIETAILAAIELGLLSTLVTGTVMTTVNSTGVAYAAAWQGTTPDRSKFEQMMIIETYFSDMGYTIHRKLITLSGTFQWEVLW